MEITDEQYQIILTCKKTVLKNGNSTWIKTSLDNFDVPVDGYDIAQIADLEGLCILNILGMIVDPIQIGLHCIDGILYIPKSDSPKCSGLQKRI